jgi:hypothetical protein
MQLRFSKPFFRKRIENKIKVLSIRGMWSNGGGIPKVGETLKLKDGSRWIKAGMPGCLKPILVDGKNPVRTGVWPVSFYESDQFSKSSPLYWICVESDFFTKLGWELPWIYYYPNSLKANNNMLNEFAIMDGWNSFSEMIEFFKPRLPLEAFIICWSEKWKF